MFSEFLCYPEKYYHLIFKLSVKVYLPWCFSILLSLCPSTISLSLHSFHLLGCLGASILNPSINTTGFPSGSNDKEFVCNMEDPGLKPGLGRSLEKGNGYPLPYSCLENSMLYTRFNIPNSVVWTIRFSIILKSSPFIVSHIQPIAKFYLWIFPWQSHVIQDIIVSHLDCHNSLQTDVPAATLTHYC